MAHVGNAFENSCIITAVGVVAILINTALITHVGRRRLFLTAGLVLCGFSQLVVAAIYTVHPGTESTGRAIVGLSVVFILGFNVSGLSPPKTRTCVQNQSDRLVF
jgi:SP family sugar:H+ symporter-like MFS transporter